MTPVIMGESGADAAIRRTLLIDIHTHVDQHNRAELPGLLGRALAAGVNAVVIAGTTVESSQGCIGLAKAYRRVFAGVGVHPYRH